MKKNNLPLLFEGFTKVKTKNNKIDPRVKSKAFQTSEMKIDAYYKRISNFINVQK